jgi:hypothetical protein
MFSHALSYNLLKLNIILLDVFCDNHKMADFIKKPLYKELKLGYLIYVLIKTFCWRSEHGFCVQIKWSSPIPHENIFPLFRLR